jgi:hypothetical protein
MEAKDLFEQMISQFLSSVLDKEAVAKQVAKDIPLDSIRGNRHDLLPNIEIALRHINEPKFYTTEAELRYYLECLRGEKVLNELERDRAIKNGIV